MTSAQIRQSFLDYFSAPPRSHSIVASSSLLPDSPGLLFTNAGMNQFVPIFLNERRPDAAHRPNTQRPALDTRAADTQKCIRAGGKHNDLEDVGYDTYHHTMFEMLGNWSFGDYFKRESLTWGWELLTKVWGIPAKRLFATVYSPDKTKNDPADFDQEAHDIWTQLFRAAGLDPALHIVNGNKKDNFWMMGDTGPCGPCSEIHFNLLPTDDEHAGRALVNAGSPRCIEIWNHVFIQFAAQADGTFAPLPARHVDTGMGFERVAGIHATTRAFTDFTPAPSNYNADVFTALFRAIATLSGKTYTGTVPATRENLTPQQRTDIAFRVIADHARAVSCAIADGILPSNEGRNYVIRRILRRGILYGRKDLALPTGFFAKLVPAVVASLGEIFPELRQQQQLIERVIRTEEESFGKTLDRGIALFNESLQAFDPLPGSARVPRAASGVPPDASETRYTKRRLPHFERPWGKYAITFSTHKRAQLSDKARRIVLDSLVFGHNNNRYLLYIACVMPDHVHILIEPQPKNRTPEGHPEFYSLTEILHSIKSFTAHEINKLEGTTGPVWEKESHDRLIRSEADLQEKFRYILENPYRDNLAAPDAEYPYIWTPDPETMFRRDAETSTRDACAPRNVIPGKLAFELYDTYGFPLDMTQLLATERGLTVDTAGFETEMEAQRARARAAQKKEVITVSGDDTGATHAATIFTGFDYTHTQHNAAPASQSATLIDIVRTEKSAYLVFDRTPFYAEMGGQVGDTGTVTHNGKTHAIKSTIKDKSGRHLHELAAPAEVSDFTTHSSPLTTLSPNLARRRAIQRHHTATHLLHWALRKVLGTHVHQAGSAVHPDALRFDFSHFEQVKPAQLHEIETLVNERILENATVSATEVPHAAVAARKDINQFFGDKYGDIVRVVQIGGAPGALDGYSMELCGGTHTAQTGELGLFKIVIETAIAAGTRRIEAIAGAPAYAHSAAHETLLKELAIRLQAGSQDLLQKFDTLLAHKTAAEKKLKLHEQRAATALSDTLAAQATPLPAAPALKQVTAVIETDSPDTLRSIGSQILAKLGEGVVKLGAALAPDKVSIVVFCSPAANKAGYQAGKLVAELCAKLDGKGGGKPDFAMGGGKSPAKLADVLK